MADSHALDQHIVVETTELDLGIKGESWVARACDVKLSATRGAPLPDKAYFPVVSADARTCWVSRAKPGSHFVYGFPQTVEDFDRVHRDTGTRPPSSTEWSGPILCSDAHVLLGGLPIDNFRAQSWSLEFLSAEPAVGHSELY